MLAVKKAQFSRMDLMISDLIGVPSGAMRQMGKMRCLMKSKLEVPQ